MILRIKKDCKITLVDVSIIANPPVVNDQLNNNIITVLL